MVIAPKKQAASISSSAWKTYAMVAFVSALGLLSSLAFRGGMWLAGGTLLTLFISSFIVELLLIGERRTVVLGSLANSIAVAAPFYSYFDNLYMVAGGVAIALFLAKGAYGGNRTAQNMMRIRFFSVARMGAAAAITGLTVFFTIVLMAYAGFSINREQTKKIVDLSIMPVARRYVPDIKSDDKLGKFISDFMSSRLSGDEQFAKLSASAKRQYVGVASDEFEKRLEKSIGSELDSDKSISENAFTILHDKLSALTPIMKMYVVAAIVLLVVISVKGMGFIIYDAFALLAFVIYELLIALGFAVVEIESRGKEIVLIK